MGEETNRTSDFAHQIKWTAALKKEYPNLAVRVHAGENSDFPKNVLEAIQAGATRIGHGRYGVTKEVLQLAKTKNVVVEFCSNSNLALQNAWEKWGLAIKKYLGAGVRVTLSTDGHGLYDTTPLSEETVARVAGLKDSDFITIQKSDARYVEKMTRRSTAKSLGKCIQAGLQ
jgi:adenosine deaminase